MIYGYARVSTDGQSVAAQVKELRDAGAEKFFRETASGAKSDRAELRSALVNSWNCRLTLAIAACRRRRPVSRNGSPYSGRASHHLSPRRYRS